ncbi:MAG: aminotransferase class I/II-fold pyridoxal phosphate-dependent enzyme [Pseudomonadales bacterium]|nr:aminotransferase class I/II-fold pyridoxal phosphate-dependent enzyme [Pseudomonadales bacterium]
MGEARKFNAIDTIDQIFTAAKEKGIIHLSTEDESFNGREITLKGQKIINFGSCSYLGLELHPKLKQGVVDAVERFGTQYSSSRAYVSCGQYDELEEHLSTIFGGHAIVTPTTTLGHIASLPVLIGDNDAVLLDQQVHGSVQTAAQLLKPKGVTVELVKHSDMKALSRKIERLRKTHRRIWYMADGVYSMYGDYAPLPEIQALMEKYEELYFYVDDAHGMSWCGENGKGYVLSQMDLHRKMVLATSLNKAYASSGGVLVFPNKEWARRVRTCGATLIFSGPIQPPMLGAAIASAKVHLSDEITGLQEKLNRNIQLVNKTIKAHGLPLMAENDAPIFFLAAGLPRIAYNIISRMKKAGFFLNIAAYPAVPMKKGGVRFTITTHHTEADILAMTEALAYHYPRALAEEGSSIAEVYKDFKLRPSHLSLLGGGKNLQKKQNKFQVQYCQNIREISYRDWDGLFSNQGNYDWEGLLYLQETFSNNPEKENNWDFHYLIIKDQLGKIVLATFLTEALIKDDMFSEVSISAQVEERRKDDPYYLTSRALMMGSLATEGQHLYLDKQHPQWRQAVLTLTQKIRELQEASQAGSMLLRDFEAGADEELKSLLLDEGYIEMPMLDNNVVRNMDWQDIDEYIARLSKKGRISLRRDVLKQEDQFIVRHDKNVSEALKQHCYQLYLNVQEKALALNTFRQPEKLINNMFDHPNWDFIFLYIKEHLEQDKQALPVAVGMCYKSEKTYSPMILGMEYQYAESHNIYKQMLYRTVMRAKTAGFDNMKFGFGASQVKRRVGAEAVPTNAYIQLIDHFNQEELANMSVKG